MQNGKTQKVFLECVDAQTAERHRHAALGLGTLFGRWLMIPAEISDRNPCSLNVEIPDFRDSDVPLLRSLPGVIEVKPFESDKPLTDPMKARREYYAQHAA